MATQPSQELIVTELDADSLPDTIYKINLTTGGLEKHTPRVSTPITASLSLLQRCVSPFLPAGYPSTVTADYTPYQIYDSLQAFASTIAGLLASRAVFVGMGVGSEDASLVTTMLLYIAQETIGRVATILFAHRFSQRIEAEVKFYRFFADIVNDIAFVLDCMSPGMPILGRVLTLCVSNACRAVCGVAGGSSKAILSSHFAQAGNIGELNAKDGSQETVVSLVGMWAGGLVVSKVQGTVATWCWLLPLLTLHLWANWKAVKSVRLHSLNAERASILFKIMLRSGQVQGPDDVGRQESVLFSGDNRIGVQVGVGLKDFLLFMQAALGNKRKALEDFQYIIEAFTQEEYLLWVDVRNSKGMILLKESASAETQIKSFCQAVRCLHRDFSLAESTADVVIQGGDTRRPISPSKHEQPDVLALVVATLQENQDQWQKVRDKAQKAGWDLALTNLVERQGHRIRMEGASKDKKEK
ncbi:hypothetical protein H2202_006467 [Exophiala xenobiotica]|nr:hypothetical protein H2202_006467 [Exophiala xenobiotica]KAK5212924.1 hypothetical protein LTR41_001872 [Exophiala xenobiotica]KAK5222105.1 hypothetical protein LTR72_006362 [Exophiala xenobiotica]KAK5295140.1 hypothetical protein LTR14_004310 [Exophiala xenobiotica]KAK5327414.1 hypothetical protein LTR93_002798 [Exophiala xenobiotica]